MQKTFVYKKSKIFMEFFAGMPFACTYTVCSLLTTYSHKVQVQVQTVPGYQQARLSAI